MNMVKRFCFIILGICMAAMMIYVSTSFYMSIRIYHLVESSVVSQGKDYGYYSDFVGRINYQCLDYSDGHSEKWEKNCHSFPIVIHNFVSAKAYYNYTIIGDSIGGENIPVTVSLERRNGRWYVTGVSEPF